MQTFLPYDDFALSARCLDRQRLGKQRVEGLQILKTLHLLQRGDNKVPWGNHPAVRMWRGNEAALWVYTREMCREWSVRGYRDSVHESLKRLFGIPGSEHIVYPEWFGDVAFHLSHRSNLVRKDPDCYRALWPTIPDDLPYLWPR